MHILLKVTLSAMLLLAILLLEPLYEDSLFQESLRIVVEAQKGMTEE